MRKNKRKTKEVDGFGKTKFTLYAGLKLMAYKNHPQLMFTNSQELTVVDWDTKLLTLSSLNGEEIQIEIHRTNLFKPRFAMTVHKAQGSTFTEEFSIYEYEIMRASMLYVALTRATEFNNVNGCSIENYEAYTGDIYSYELKGKYQIGSTVNLDKRCAEHKSGTKCGDTKFKAAIVANGYNAFKYRLLETIKFSNIQQLWHLEDKYIAKYDSISHGFNMRRNTSIYDPDNFYDNCETTYRLLYGHDQYIHLAKKNIIMFLTLERFAALACQLYVFATFC